MEGCEGWLGVWNVRFSQTIKWIFFSQNLGTSTAASALSIYIDTIFNKDISNGLRHTNRIQNFEKFQRSKSFPFKKIWWRILSKGKTKKSVLPFEILK